MYLTGCNPVNTCAHTDGHTNTQSWLHTASLTVLINRNNLFRLAKFECFSISSAEGEQCDCCCGDRSLNVFSHDMAESHDWLWKVSFY